MGNIYEKIAKECFWDYNMSADDICKIITSGSKNEKKKLFSKIIYNSQNRLSALRLFSKDELKEFFDDFKPTYNQKYLTKIILALRAILLDEDVVIKELEWKKR